MTINTPIQIGGIGLKNRLIMAPLQQYAGTPDGFATNHHTEFYSRRANQVSLVIVESTAVSDSGRLFNNDIGIFTDCHIEPLRKITEAVHAKQTPLFIQLSHGGRKSSPLVTKKLIAPSPIAYDEHYGSPEAMSLADIQQVVEQYRIAAKRSVLAGFDGIEIHAAHGFLIHQFLSPLSNQRLDSYGGSPENRSRFLKDVLTVIRGEVGKKYPIMVRVSATDYVKGGLFPEDIARMLQPLESELDAVHVSTGGLVSVQPNHIYPAYQVPHAAIIKQHLRVPVIAVGLIDSRSLADHILQDQLADMIAIGRPLIEDPDFAAQLLQ